MERPCLVGPFTPLPGQDVGPLRGRPRLVGSPGQEKGLGLPSEGGGQGRLPAGMGLRDSSFEEREPLGRVTPEGASVTQGSGDLNKVKQVAGATTEVEGLLQGNLRRRKITALQLHAAEAEVRHDPVEWLVL